jgi:hypothetical protein
MRKLDKHGNPLDYPPDQRGARLQRMSVHYGDLLWPDRIEPRVETPPRKEEDEEDEDEEPIMQHVRIRKAIAAKLKVEKTPEEEVLWRYAEEMYLYGKIYRVMSRYLKRYSDNFGESMERVLTGHGKCSFILDIFTGRNLTGDAQRRTVRIKKRLLICIQRSPEYDEIWDRKRALQAEVDELRDQRNSGQRAAPGEESLSVQMENLYIEQFALGRQLDLEVAEKLRKIEELGIHKLHEIIAPYDSTENPHNILLYAIARDFVNVVRAFEKLLWYERPDRFRDFYNENRREGTPDFDDLCTQVMTSIDVKRKINPAYSLQVL